MPNAFVVCAIEKLQEQKEAAMEKN